MTIGVSAFGVRSSRLWRCLLRVSGFAVLSLPVSPTAEVRAAGERPAAPATVVEAARVLDPRALPLAEGAEPPQYRNVAGFSYRAAGAVTGVFAFHRKQLTDRSWSESPGGFVSDQSANGTFTRDGFSVSLTVFPAGKPGTVSVLLTNHGNVDLNSLPVPPGVKPFFGGPVSASFLTETPVAKAADGCRTSLLAKGWQPYGSAGDTQFFKQNAVRLAVRVSSAPAQGGKTVIDYSTTLMSVDLPAPADADGLQYADATTQLLFDTKTSAADVAGFYRTALAAAGWAATTAAPVKVGFKDALIFRNPQKDMLTLEVYKVADKNRVSLKHQSAAEVADVERRLDAKAEQRAMAKNKPAPRLSLSLPRGATDVERTKTRIEFKVASGKAKAVVAAWRTSFATDGWKEDVTVLEDVAGSLSFTKGGQRLTVVYADTGVVPAEITVQAAGFEFDGPDIKP